MTTEAEIAQLRGIVASTDARLANILETTQAVLETNRVILGTLQEMVLSFREARADSQAMRETLTLGRPGLGEVYATLVNTALNALRLEGWFPSRMSMPLRAKTCAFRPMQTIARLCGQAS